MMSDTRCSHWSSPSSAASVAGRRVTVAGRSGRLADRRPGRPPTASPTGDQDAPPSPPTATATSPWSGRTTATAPDPRTTPTARSTCACSATASPLYEMKLSAGGTRATTWRHISPDVGLDDKGNAVVVWADDPDGNGFYNIPYRVVSPAGTVLRLRQRQRQRRPASRSSPQVAVDPDGAPSSASAVAFTVVWEDIQDRTPATVKAAGYTASDHQGVRGDRIDDHRRAPPARRRGVRRPATRSSCGTRTATPTASYNIGLIRLAKANGAVDLSRRTANAHSGGQQRTRPSAAQLQRRLRRRLGVRPHRNAGRRGRGRSPSTGTARHADVEVADRGERARRSASTTRPTGRRLVGPGHRPRRLGPRLQPRRHRPPAGCRPSSQPAAPTGRQEQMAVAVSPWGEVALAYTDDNDGNTFDQIYLGQDFSNNSW